MTTISLKVDSVSATKSQSSNAKILFGARGESLLSSIETLVKAKELDTSKLSHVLDVLKSEETTAKYGASAGGKKNVATLKLLLKAKTLLQAVEVVAKVKIPKGFA
ncbi:hypothetical protein HOU08_gp164 [Dickeya phage vB_DsoM_JA29]|uniref:Uncharacterized protein n=1 Tax=Dickeya phage vB_DsoM_JA29 TaxID=2283031 RepID=A0A384ZXA2_9CAUD|nr:hypothetical protein HOU08_gp164 [Dickeya phage vB_DsoM_JA29]AXG66890.1 hypothetical protein JA29_164 [Dickeya phage vB_DsoM_JA29]